MLEESDLAAYVARPLSPYISGYEPHLMLYAGRGHLSTLTLEITFGLSPPSFNSMCRLPPKDSGQLPKYRRGAAPVVRVVGPDYVGESPEVHSDGDGLYRTQGPSTMQVCRHCTIA